MGVSSVAGLVEGGIGGERLHGCWVTGGGAGLASARVKHMVAK